MSAPFYSPEFVDGADLVIRRHLWPTLVAAGELRAADVAMVLEPIHGHPMAKAALEMAILDAELRAICDPVATDQQAFDDQRALIAHHGGREAALKLGAPAATPPPAVG